MLEHPFKLFTFLELSYDFFIVDQYLVKYIPYIIFKIVQICSALNVINTRVLAFPSEKFVSCY